MWWIPVSVVIVLLVPAGMTAPSALRAVQVLQST